MMTLRDFCGLFSSFVVYKIVAYVALIKLFRKESIVIVKINVDHDSRIQIIK